MLQGERRKVERLAKEEITSTLSQQQLKTSKRQHDDWKAGGLLENSLSSFASFLEMYSAVVELVNEVEGKSRGLAYSTLSVLLMVGVRSSQERYRSDVG